MIIDKLKTCLNYSAWPSASHAWERDCCALRTAADSILTEYATIVYRHKAFTREVTQLRHFLDFAGSSSAKISPPQGPMPVLYSTLVVQNLSDNEHRPVVLSVRREPGVTVEQRCAF